MPDFHLQNAENSSSSLREKICELQEWVKNETHIRLRAASYYLNTELYDLSLPGCFSRHDEWIPRSDYLSQSRRNATKERQHQTNDLSPAEIKKFKIYSQDYARFSVKKLEEEVEVLKRQTASE